MVQEAGMKGSGAFARQAVAAGDLVISERPLVRWWQDDHGTAEQNLEKLHQQLSQLQNSGQHALYAQYFSLSQNFYEYSGPARTAIGIWMSNAFDTDSEEKRPDGLSSAGVFFYISHVNHSCLPNCRADWDEGAAKLVLRAVSDVACGEELTISYIGVVNAPRRMRRNYLVKHFHFDCGCVLCERGDDWGARAIDVLSEVPV
mmetsp:Transcript_20933/g.34567  ORF Transcript_20933/g.34567 Transcript_20933/m.34567 type:complete len:202 (+) Transcript_20933:214-819(+)